MVDSIDGIPVRKISDVIMLVLSRYERIANDIAIRADIISDLQIAIGSGEIYLM